jgi:hypothetical protein
MAQKSKIKKYVALALSSGLALHFGTAVALDMASDSFKGTITEVDDHDRAFTVLGSEYVKATIHTDDGKEKLIYAFRQSLDALGDRVLGKEVEVKSGWSFLNMVQMSADIKAVRPQ